MKPKISIVELEWLKKWRNSVERYFPQSNQANWYFIIIIDRSRDQIPVTSQKLGKKLHEITYRRQFYKTIELKKSISESKEIVKYSKLKNPDRIKKIDNRIKKLDNRMKSKVLNQIQVQQQNLRNRKTLQNSAKWCFFCKLMIRSR